MQHDWRREMVEGVAKALKSYGYTVYLASGGMHGFYTDGKRVVSFEYRLGDIHYSGNYSTDRPQSTGTGWGLGDYVVIGKERAAEFITANAQRWAVGDAKVQYTTPEAHLRMYGSSSGYTLFE